jgi:hypothetical protein
MLKFVNQEGAYNPAKGCTRFFGMDGAKRIQFTIRRDALERLEGGKDLPDHALNDAFRRHRETIHAKAIERAKAKPDDCMFGFEITAEDFPAPKPAAGDDDPAEELWECRAAR